MIINNGFENLKINGPVVTTGIFDGVHTGHRMLLSHLTGKARETGGESVVITFSPHPRIVLEKDQSGLSYLTTIGEKCGLLESLGIDQIVIIEFTREFSNLSACDFVERVLADKVMAKHLVIGYNHHFGRGREGNFPAIEKCAESHGIVVEQVGRFVAGESAVSSSMIRNALLDGRLEEANRLLGYGYSVKGTVVRGKQLGREIGFPTANIEPDDPFKLIPAKGVYAVEVKLDNTIWPGMLSIGSNPTVNKDPLKRFIEVNILNFTGDIYGRTIDVVFRKWLRNEQKFSSVNELMQQLTNDRQQVSAFFSLTSDPE
jgi:riboflavin kinase / FMN adenylyltransferase